MILTRHDRRVRVARVTVEAVSPLHCGSGRGDDVSDADVLRDMNDLPTIAGTSLAGVLRAMFRAAGADQLREAALFGDQEQGSRLTVSFGLVVDGRGRVVEGLLPSDRDDDVLKLLRPLDTPLRKHVRITDRGVADAEGRGLFDERIVPAGTRFVFELGLAGGGGGEERDFDLLLDIVRGGLRVGGHTRRGLGLLRPIRIASRSFDLAQESDRRAFASLPTPLAENASVLQESPLGPGAPGNRPTLRLLLRPRTPWAIGSDTPWRQRDKDQNEEDISIYREPAILWGKDGRGRPEERVVVPATSIKGVLAHRVAWHANVAALRAGRVEEARTGRPGFEAVALLFGSEGSGVAGNEVGGGDARAGIVFVDDAVLNPSPEIDKTVLLTHSGIDRFTGGVREGVLFSERLVAPGTPFETRLEIDDRAGHDVPASARESLRLALEDLRGGKWQIGQGYGRGHGWVEGKIEWLQGADWLTKGDR